MPGDFWALGPSGYSPDADGAPDPGEIVWTWVPYEEDHAQGKDRPVLVIGHNRGRLLALMLTPATATTPRRRDEDYLDVGTGPWDRRAGPARSSWTVCCRLDRR